MKKLLIIALIVLFAFSVLPAEASNYNNYQNPDQRVLPVNLVQDPNFANFGSYIGPWGVNVLYGENGIWWNSKFANTQAYTVSLSGGEIHTALYIVNKSKKSPHVYGTTAQRIRGLKPGKTYRIILWGAARGLQSNGGINIAIDPGWHTRPIHFPAGSYGWTLFSNTFVAPNTYIDLRIISEDIGEAWITGVIIVAE